MCGIVGFVNFKQVLTKHKNVLLNMNSSLINRGPDEDGYYIKEHVALAHKRLIVIDQKVVSNLWLNNYLKMNM